MYLAAVLRATSMLLLYLDRCNIYLAAVLRATSMLLAWHTWPQHVSCCLNIYVGGMHIRGLSPAVASRRLRPSY